MRLATARPVGTPVSCEPGTGTIPVQSCTGTGNLYSSLLVLVLFASHTEVLVLFASHTEVLCRQGSRRHSLV